MCFVCVKLSCFDMGRVHFVGVTNIYMYVCVWDKMSVRVSFLYVLRTCMLSVAGYHVCWHILAWILTTSVA